MIRVERATVGHLTRVDLGSPVQEQLRALILRLPRADVERVLLTKWARVAIHADGTVLCVAGVLDDGATWALLSEHLAKRDCLAVFRIVRAGIAEFMAETGITPYSEPERGVPEAPRVAHALGFRYEGSDRWAWKPH